LRDCSSQTNPWLASPVVSKPRDTPLKKPRTECGCHPILSNYNTRMSLPAAFGAFLTVGDRQTKG
jgi:hypothetical protein